MKVAVASHSLVAERQSWFWDYFGTLPGVEVKKFAPKNWGVHYVPWGYEVIAHYKNDNQDWQHASGTDSPNMYTFEFPPDALLDLEKFSPDLIFVQNEAYCIVTRQMLRMARRIGCRFALFTWENINPYDKISARVLKSADLVFCASQEAEDLVKPWTQNTVRMLQVGVNTEVFKPMAEVEKDYDVIFIGRMVPEKGIDVLKRAVEGTNIKVLWPSGIRVPYKDLPDRFNMARVHAAPSIDFPHWKEQHGSYANLEALSCELYVATSHSTCIHEWLRGCPGVSLARQNDPEDLRGAILDLLVDQRARNLGGREWVEERFSYKVYAEKFKVACESILRSGG